MVGDPNLLCGRERELDSLRREVATVPPSGRLIVVRGPAGVGRTALLRRFGAELEATQTSVVWARSRGGDHHGVNAVLEGIAEHAARCGDERLFVAVARARRTVTANPGTLRAVAALGELTEHLVVPKRCLFIVDDVHLAAAPALSLEALRRAGAVVVAAVADELRGAPSMQDVLAAADDVFTLEPLTAAAMKEILERRFGKPVDMRVELDLRAALDRWSGYPGTVLGVVEEMNVHGRLAEVGGVITRTDRRPISLPTSHRLWTALRSHDGIGTSVGLLVASMTAWPVHLIPILAAAQDGTATQYGREVDNLAEAGFLDDDGQGLLTFTCPALGQTLLEETGEPALRRLHSHLAEYLFTAELDKEPELLSEHLSRAGELDSALDGATWLMRRVQEEGHRFPDDAAAWCVGAVRLAGQGKADRTRLVSGALRFLIRGGHYAQIEEVFSQLAPQESPSLDQADDWAAARLLASFHAGIPATIADVGGAVSGRFDEVAAAWCGEGDWPPPGSALSATETQAERKQLLTAAEIHVLEVACRGDLQATSAAWAKVKGDRPPEEAVERLVDAALLADIGFVLEQVVGETLPPPRTGLVYLLSRALRDYRAAEWSAALSCLRELEVTGPSSTRAHHIGRLLAAEICAQRGETRNANEWLERADEATEVRALRCCVRFGLSPGHTGQRRLLNEAVEILVVPALGQAEPGIGQLLVRAAEAADTQGDAECLALLEKEAERRWSSRAIPDAREVLDFVQGIASRDAGRARAAVASARRRGHLPLAARASLQTARLVDDPLPWLDEAAAIARRCGAVSQLAAVNTMARDRGLSLDRPSEPVQPFTEVEIDVLRALKAGAGNREIAADLWLTEKTVEYYLSRLFNRTGCRSRVELVAALFDGRVSLAGADSATFARRR
ncbi:LuxR C-terminal-related transcriptional regulator [Amycolatopsis japonica]